MEQTDVQTWQGGRERGLIWVTVPGQRWTRVVHDWEIGRLRSYLRMARQLPAETRLAIFRWLEQQEATIEAEQTAAELRDQRDGYGFWLVCFSSLVVVVGCLLVAMGVEL